MNWIQKKPNLAIFSILIKAQTVVFLGHVLALPAVGSRERPIQPQFSWCTWPEQKWELDAQRGETGRPVARLTIDSDFYHSEATSSDGKVLCFVATEGIRDRYFISSDYLLRFVCRVFVEPGTVLSKEILLLKDREYSSSLLADAVVFLDHDLRKESGIVRCRESRPRVENQ
ncbi:MAG: hypothetical protein IT289_05590 [Oligoflexia bacterium]|nr:hypothetical protein [Oligoflexia bacterium]